MRSRKLVYKSDGKSHKCSTKKQTEGKCRRGNKKHEMGGSNIHTKTLPEEK